MKKIEIDNSKLQVTVPLIDDSPRIVLLTDGRAGVVELPSHCEVVIKVHDGTIKYVHITEKHDVKALLA